jgi:hypothetical protein
MENLIKFLGSLQTFFNDFVGAVAPAVILVAGIWLIPGVQLPIAGLSAAWGEYLWLPAMAVLFGVGHLLLGVATFARRFAAKWIASWRRPEAATSSPPLRRLRAVLDSVLPLPTHVLAPENVRNIAMTLSSDGEELGRRFIFLSQFCFGAGIASLIVGLAWLISAFAVTDDPLTPALEPPALVTAALIFIAAVLAWLVLTQRGIQFRNQAFRLPFDAALAEFASKKLDLPKETTAPAAITSGTVGTASDPVAPGAPVPAVLPRI